MPDFSVGVDISKAHLDAYRAPDGTAARFTNDATGFKALIAWIECPVRAVTYEPKGHWHRAFEEALLTAKLPLARVNPLQARRFAQAIGQRAKTDAVDARVLAQMGTALDLRPTERTSPAWRALEELQVARDALIRDRTAALTRRAEILTSIPGVSRITATGLLIQMPELGRLDAKAVASLAGLAPVTRQSGTWHGQSFIRAGQAQVRRILYMPAVTAMRCNPDLRAKYRQLVAQGKPGKVALVAVMRKLLVLANALLEQDRNWQPERPGQDRTGRHPPERHRSSLHELPHAPGGSHLTTWILRCLAASAYRIPTTSRDTNGPAARDGGSCLRRTKGRPWDSPASGWRCSTYGVATEKPLTRGAGSPRTAPTSTAVTKATIPRATISAPRRRERNGSTRSSRR